MTPSYDRNTLFLAPPARSDAERADRSRPVVDDRAEAMQELRHPFAIRAEPVGFSVR